MTFVILKGCRQKSVNSSEEEDIELNQRLTDHQIKGKKTAVDKKNKL